jgi:arylsulfatase A-like enzyme
MTHYWFPGFIAVISFAGCLQRPDPDATPPARSAPVVASAARAATAQDADKPTPKPPYNVLLIGIDSLRADMPWTGYSRPIAPWLTEFQKRCTTYTRAYSLSSYTAQSVVPMLVGEHPSAMKRDGKFFTRYPDPDNLFISERAQRAGHRTLAGNAHGYFLPMLGNNQGFDDYRLIEGGVDLKAVTSITSQKLTPLARQMLSDPKNVQLAEGKRFFAFFHYMDPHHTYEKHAEHPDFGSKPRDVYDNEVHYTDHWVGQLVDFALGQPWGKHTVVIITADHGEGFGEHGHSRHAYEVWEALVKVPLIVCVPGAPPRKVDVRRSHVDLAPTIAELMRLPMDPPFRGRSLVPELFGGPIEPRRIIVEVVRNNLMDRRRAVIADGHKLIAFGDDVRFELYDLDEDPAETEEISKSAPERLEQMKKIYFEESEKVPRVPVVGGGALKGAPPGRGY